MRANLCWTCGKVNKCQKTFPHGRPKRRNECADFIEAPKGPARITISEIADKLGCSTRTVFRILASRHGVYRVTHLMKGKGIILTYERIKNRIYFYKEMNRDER